MKMMKFASFMIRFFVWFQKQSHLLLNIFLFLPDQLLFRSQRFKMFFSHYCLSIEMRHFRYPYPQEKFVTVAAKDRGTPPSASPPSSMTSVQTITDETPSSVCRFLFVCQFHRLSLPVCSRHRLSNINVCLSVIYPALVAYPSIGYYLIHCSFSFIYSSIHLFSRLFIHSIIHLLFMHQSQSRQRGHVANTYTRIPLHSLEACYVIARLFR